MKRTILFFVCLMGITFAFAQTSLQDVVYLKNGSIIRGDIIEMVPGETIKIMTSDGSVFVHDYADVQKFTKEQPVSTINKNAYSVEKKSPWASGFMSFFVPGLGQLYNGESRKGFIDFATHVGGYAATLAGLGLTMEYSGYDDYYYGEDGTIVYEYKEGNTFLATTGLVLFSAGLITVYANWIHTVCDAVKSSNRINAENGYVMYQLNDRCAFGMQPSIAYERPQYLQGSKPEFSAGMNFKLTF